MATAVACGGRDNLSTGWEEYEDTATSGTNAGGSVAGSSSSTVAGRANGGATSTGGSGGAGRAGAAGASGRGGNGGSGGGNAVCIPGTMACDVTGTTLLTCSSDGTRYESTNCAQLGQRCIEDACQTPECEPGKLYCDGNDLIVCNPDGTRGFLKQRCSNGQYCDPQTLSCQDFLCRANQPVCNGEVATFCDEAGTAYLPGGKNCSQYPSERCVNGSCTCKAASADCNGIEQDGCEVDLKKDPDNCGACGTVCSSAHVASRTCSGACNGSCQAGYADCDGDKQENGCETATSNDVTNCGGCGIACSTNNISATCGAGTCNGKCVGRYRDCNGDKLTDGCEVDTRVDLDHCGGCGLTCSDNHVTPTCKASKCSGACDAGFADCNADKQKDGCETDTSNDSKNCGACGKVCGAGTSCTQGKCASVFAFSGIKQNLPTASLVGWTECFSGDYGDPQSLASVLQACVGSKLLMACRKAGSDVLQLAAYADKSDVMFDTGNTDKPHNANGVGWYFSAGQSWGFAPQGDPIHRYTCDIVASDLEPAGVNGDKRLCWHTSPGALASGWRCGSDDMLNTDHTFERVLFTAP